MIWSDDARLLCRPVVTHGELAAGNDARPIRTALLPFAPDVVAAMTARMLRRRRDA